MDRMSSIDLAIRNETAEMEFYLAEASRSRNPVAKRLFETLAEDEQEHMTRLRALHGKLTTAGSWPGDVTLEIAGTNVRQVLENLDRNLETAAHDDDDIAALERGIDFEQKGSRFYADLAKTCTNPREQQFFGFLAGIEREHMLSIKDSLFYLQDPQGWLEEKGRAGLDGA